MSEFVYILTNESMPGYIKIGMTTRPVLDRMRELDGTNLPLPFECYYACSVEDARREELWLHNIFEDRRVRDNREFFLLDPERVVAALKRIQIEDVTPKDFINMTPEQEKKVEEKKKRRARFSFSEFQIPIGSILTFSRDESVQAIVLQNNRIELNGKETSLSDSAQKLLGYNKAVAGTLYWKFEGETLDERRRRLEF